MTVHALKSISYFIELNGRFHSLEKGTNNLQLTTLAAIAENCILKIKRRLYMILRGSLSRDWVKFLPNVIRDINNTPVQRLGWLKPNDIVSEESSVLVDEAKRQHKVPILKEPTYEEQKLNTETAKTTTDLKQFDYVYKQFDSKLFDKSFDVSVNIG